MILGDKVYLQPMEVSRALSWHVNRVKRNLPAIWQDGERYYNKAMVEELIHLTNRLDEYTKTIKQLQEGKKIIESKLQDTIDKYTQEGAHRQFYDK